MHKTENNNDHILAYLEIELNSQQILDIVTNLSISFESHTDLGRIIIERTSEVLWSILLRCRLALGRNIENPIAKSCSTVKNRFFRKQIRQIKDMLSKSIGICISTKEFKLIQEYYKFGKTSQPSLIYKGKEKNIFIKNNDLDF